MLCHRRFKAGPIRHLRPHVRHHVGQLLIDAKVPWSLRSAVPLLCDTNSILWVVGIRRSAEAAVTGKSKKVVAVRARSLEESTGTREGPSH